ncbi:MAG: hypothetical protein LM591_01040 [Candidatus Korarchaeum sp.]|nr:hypothetical protein [Candidatus Korarchaeum sp.]
MRKMPMILLLIISIDTLPISGENYFIIKDSYWEGYSLVLGANNTFVVEARSSYSGILSDINATLKIYNFVSSDYTTSFSYPGSLSKGQSLYMRFTVSVPANAYASHYKAELFLRFKADGMPQNQAIPLFITIQGSPRVVCSISGSLRPGWPATIYIEVENIGDGVARNVMISLTPTSLGVQVASPIDLGLMNPAESRKVQTEVYVADNVDEAVTITATVTWGAQVGTGGQYTTTQTLPVSEVGPKGVSVFAKDIYLEPGVNNTVSLLVENEGDEWAYRAKMTIQTPPGVSVIGSNTFDLGDLGPGKLKMIPVSLSILPQVSGPIQILASLRWLDAGGEERTSSSTLGFYVRIPTGPFLTAFSDKRVLKPGVPESVVIYLKNDGNETARNIRASLIASKDLAVLSETGVSVGDLEPGASKGISTLLYAPNMSYGSLILTVELNYMDEHDSTRTQAIPISFITESPKQPLLILIPLNNELKNDETNELCVEIKNEGGLAKDLRIELAFPSPEIGSIVGTGRAYIESLDRGESALRNFTVYLSPNVYGAVQMIARISYRDESGIDHMDVTTLGVRASGEPRIEVAHVSTVPTPIYPGDSNVKLVTLITNVGSYVAKDLRLNLTSLPSYVEPSYSGSDTFLIPALPPGQSMEVRFILKIKENARPGRYELKLVSKYGEAKLPLQIDEKASFELIELNASGKPRPGDRGVKLSLILRNRADVTANDAVIEIVTPYLIGTTSLAIGDVPARSNASAIMEVDIDKQAPLQIPIDIKITWKQDGRSLSQTIKASLNLVSGGVEPWGILIVIVLSLVTLLAIFRRRIKFSDFFSRARTERESS